MFNYYPNPSDPWEGAQPYTFMDFSTRRTPSWLDPQVDRISVAAERELFVPAFPLLKAMLRTNWSPADVYDLFYAELKDWHPRLIITALAEMVQQRYPTAKFTQKAGWVVGNDRKKSQEVNEYYESLVSRMTEQLAIWSRIPAKQRSFMARAKVQVFRWLQEGANTILLGPNMQGVFDFTSLTDIQFSDLVLPFDAFYLALPGFDGEIFTPLTGHHKIRGIMIGYNEKGALGTPAGQLNIAFWGKPKIIEEYNAAVGKVAKRWDDYWTITSVRTDIKVGDMEAYISKLFDPRFNPSVGVNRQDPKGIEGMARAFRILMNLIIYWNTEEGQIHASMSGVQERIDDYRKLRDEIRQARSRRKVREATRKYRQAERNLDKPRWRFIERPDEDFVSGETVQERGALGYKRRAPVFHPVKGHWRTLYKGTPREKKIRVKPHVRGEDLPPRMWRSRLDDLGRL